MLRAGPLCAQKKERSEMTEHEGGEDMEWKRKECVWRGKDERGTKWRGRKTTKPSLTRANLGRPSLVLYCARCVCAQGVKTILRPLQSARAVAKCGWHLTSALDTSWLACRLPTQFQSFSKSWRSHSVSLLSRSRRQGDDDRSHLQNALAL